ncbi:hypothetical protein HCC61_14860 [Streptomyces sp. HNM0575]|uniref:PrpF domain-containing protein n=1 Tax=Streptomyces sp. HNM0575 TaxID=2716338 RepID=UPI00145D308E|nr:PrpF domain-containing protein [Streptomyces sp. HNM0575]NLU73945.1 hypothetical protein [Streptomyces sp. HNM0575]
MIGHLAYATGSPCPTLVLDRAGLPQGGPALRAALAEARRALTAEGMGHVLKIALVQPSLHPMFDLDYEFVQAMPDALDSFDHHGSCGHSILSTALVAERTGMLPPLSVGSRVRVQVLNNGDSVVCEAGAIDGDVTQFTVHFVRGRPVPVTDLLITDRPRTAVTVDGRQHEVSLVSSGNAYAFIDARAVGIEDTDALFADDPDLFDRLGRIRAAVTDLLKWPRGGAFPKIAALLPSAGGIAARAISVPSWHPTIALTGAVCLGSAIRIPHTVPWRIARELGEPEGLLDIVTPGGVSAVTADVRDIDGVPALSWASVDRKRVTFQGTCPLEPSASSAS